MCSPRRLLYLSLTSLLAVVMLFVVAACGDDDGDRGHA